MKLVFIIELMGWDTNVCLLTTKTDIVKIGINPKNVLTLKHSPKLRRWWFVILQDESTIIGAAVAEDKNTEVSTPQVAPFHFRTGSFFVAIGSPPCFPVQNQSEGVGFLPSYTLTTSKRWLDE